MQLLIMISSVPNFLQNFPKWNLGFGQSVQKKRLYGKFSCMGNPPPKNSLRKKRRKTNSWKNVCWESFFQNRVKVTNLVDTGQMKITASPDNRFIIRRHGITAATGKTSVSQEIVLVRPQICRKRVRKGWRWNVATFEKDRKQIPNLARSSQKVLNSSMKIQVCKQNVNKQ